MNDKTRQLINQTSSYFICFIHPRSKLFIFAHNWSCSFNRCFNIWKPTARFRNNFISPLTCFQAVSVHWMLSNSRFIIFVFSLWLVQWLITSREHISIPNYFTIIVVSQRLIPVALQPIQGGPEKNRTAYFPQYVDKIIVISVGGNFSWEKRYLDYQYWFSSLFFRAHFVRQCRDPKFSLFSLNYAWMNALSACHICEQ